MTRARRMSWYLYLAANHTLAEIYIGVTKDRGSSRLPAGWEASVLDRWREHCASDTLTLKKWDCAADALELLDGEEVGSQHEASLLAHRLERDPELLATEYPEAAELVTEKGYQVLVTAGV